MRQVKTEVSKIYQQAKTESRILAFQGGTRAGKTYAILQSLVFRALQKKGDVYTICRQYLPSLKATALRDFLIILESLDIYEPKKHNKSDHTYNLNGNLFEFISVDQPQKVRGRQRQQLFINEANEIDFESFTQLSLRTNGLGSRIIIDYNPSFTQHWIYDKVLTRSDCQLFISTYLDNPFLDATTIAEIERLKETDENYWRIYGQGLRATSSSQIFTHQQIVSQPIEGGEVMYGLDFGYTHPTAMVKMILKDNTAYFEEVIYQSNLTSQDLLELIKSKGITKSTPIYCDYSRPEIITELTRAGYNAQNSNKSVEAGIDCLKTTIILLDKSSTNLIKEFNTYSWKTNRDGDNLQEPVKFRDDAVDACRYALYTHTEKAKQWAGMNFEVF